MIVFEGAILQEGTFLWDGQRKLLLSFMVRGLMLFYGVTATAALTPSEIKESANDSMVLLSIIDGHGKRWTG